MHEVRETRPGHWCIRARCLHQLNLDQKRQRKVRAFENTIYVESCIIERDMSVHLWIGGPEDHANQSSNRFPVHVGQAYHTALAFATDTGQACPEDPLNVPVGFASTDEVVVGRTVLVVGVLVGSDNGGSDTVLVLRARR